MAAKTSAFLGSRTCMFGTSLASPGAGELPYSKMVWASTVAPSTSVTGGNQTWPSGDLDNVNRWNDLIGRYPDSVRLYANGSAGYGTTGVTGSAGAYGLISPDWRDIANLGIALCITTKLTDAADWAQQTADLNASGSNQTKTWVAQIATNMRRWYNDSGNTAPVKKLIYGIHHEPENDGKPASTYVAFMRAIHDYMASQGGVGAGPRPSSYTGSAPWLDMIEWCYVGIGTSFSGGTNAFYPGDSYITWCLADPYNWAGGQYAEVCKPGKIAQPGDNITTAGYTPNSHYSQSWATFKDTVQNILGWSDNHPDILLGLGEFSTSHDVDRWTVNSSGTLVTPKVHTGIPTAAGEWYRQIPRVCQGLASESGVNTINVSAADARAKRLKLIHAWPSEDKMPRWINQKSWAPGDVSTPTTAHTAWSVGGTSAGYVDTSMLDGFKFAANHVWFQGTAGGGGTSHTAPSGVSITATVSGSDTSIYTFSGVATAGDSAITSWGWEFGDGYTATGQSVTYAYLASGIVTVRLTVTDANGLSTVATKILTVTLPGAVQPPATVDLGLTYIPPDDQLRIADFRPIYNGNLDKIEAYLQTLVAGGVGSLSITDPGSQSATVGTAFSLTVAATNTTGGTLTWAASGLPAGLSMASSTGIVSGTPTTAGTLSATVSVTSSTGPSASLGISWVTSSSGAVSVNDPGALAAVVGTAYSRTLTATNTAGGTLTWTASSLPAGLSIASATGVISGTPTTATSYSSTITATASVGPTAGSVGVAWTVTSGTTTPPTVVTSGSVGTTSAVGSLSVPISSSAAAGDVMVVMATIRVNGGWNTPAGWSIIEVFDGTNQELAIYRRTLVSGDLGGSVVVDPTVTNSIAACYIILRGVSTSAPLAASGELASETQPAASSIDVPAVTTTVGNTLNIALAMQLKGNTTAQVFTNPSGWTSRASTYAHNGTNGQQLTIWTKTQSTSGTTGSLSIASDASNTGLGAMVPIGPA